jgi:hypothetical protein
MMMPLEAQSHAFVVRIWEERRDVAGAPAVWRGFVCDVRSGARVYFTTLAALCSYLAGQTGITGLPAGTGDDTEGGREPPR